LAVVTGLSFALGEEQVAIRNTARAFANEQLAPLAIKWDQEKFFPAASPEIMATSRALQRR
jgi:alkylation response protein AidB-like acyl-CoA dehydrogenase